MGSSLGESKEALASLWGLRTGREKGQLVHRLSLNKTALPCPPLTIKASPRKYYETLAGPLSLRPQCSYV